MIRKQQWSQVWLASVAFGTQGWLSPEKNRSQRLRGTTCANVESRPTSTHHLPSKLCSRSNASYPDVNTFQAETFADIRHDAMPCTLTDTTNLYIQTDDYDIVACLQRSNYKICLSVEVHYFSFPPIDSTFDTETGLRLVGQLFMVFSWRKDIVFAVEIRLKSTSSQLIHRKGTINLVPLFGNLALVSLVELSIVLSYHYCWVHHIWPDSELKVTPGRMKRSHPLTYNCYACIMTLRKSDEGLGHGLCSLGLQLNTIDRPTRSWRNLRLVSYNTTVVTILHIAVQRVSCSCLTGCSWALKFRHISNYCEGLSGADWKTSQGSRRKQAVLPLNRNPLWSTASHIESLV